MQGIMNPTGQPNKTLFLNTNKWYKVLLVWELYRIPYNFLTIIGVRVKIKCFFLLKSTPNKQRGLPAAFSF